MVTIRYRSFFDLQAYETTFEQMRSFTLERQEDTVDEIWFLEHHSVYTQGQAGKPEHILQSNTIPIVQSDRGGQITYHGPGQLMTYCLLDLKRRNLGARSLVCALENSFIELLDSYNLQGITRKNAPGVYLKENGAKIASIGLRIRKGYSYHGVSFNLTMDLSPFKAIRPCGIEDLTLAQLSSYVPDVTRADVETRLQRILANHLVPQTKLCMEYS
ncbi:MAG TPA: lipoyl(octanoyl) transferase LipB [Gammaproteobacteria bacterium]|nr:lipoyl(octanoyl) transferase LipB [Gammaproteobacteria bacterium]